MSTTGPNVTPAPSTAHSDGINRAVRTVIGGVITSALVAGGSGLLASVGAVQWTHAYWTSLGTLLVSSLLAGAVSYGMRRFMPPQP